MTIELLDPEVDTTNTTERGWRVVIFNNDYSPYDVIVLSIQKGAGLSEEVAEMIAKEAHLNDSAIVKRGLSQDKAEAIAETVTQISALGGRFEPVTCEAQKDE